METCSSRVSARALFFPCNRGERKKHWRWVSDSSHCRPKALSKTAAATSPSYLSLLQSLDCCLDAASMVAAQHAKRIAKEGSRSLCFLLLRLLSLLLLPWPPEVTPNLSPSHSSLPGESPPAAAASPALAPAPRHPRPRSPCPKLGAQRRQRPLRALDALGVWWTWPRCIMWYFYVFFKTSTS